MISLTLSVRMSELALTDGGSRGCNGTSVW